MKVVNFKGPVLRSPAFPQGVYRSEERVEQKSPAQVLAHIAGEEIDATVADLIGDLRAPGYPERGGFYQYTASGRLFFPCDPRPEEVFIADIATGLASQGRFNGQTIRFLSAAEHSILVSEIVPRHMALEALMHDGSEAYIGDIIRPLKKIPAFAKVYLPIERGIEQVIADRYGLTYPWPDEVMRADESIGLLEFERNINSIQPSLSYDGAKRVAGVQLRFHNPFEARWAFLQRFMELAEERGVTSH